MANWVTRLLGVFGALPAPPAAVPVHEEGYTDDSNGWGITSDDEKTPELRWPLNIDVYDQMRRQDAQVISVLRAVTLPIRRTAWRIDPNGAPDEVVQFIAQNLGLPVKGQSAAAKAGGRMRDRFSWPQHLRLALLSLTFGHSVFEQVYRIGADGRAWIRKLGWRPPRTISKVDVAPDGGLVAIEQGADHRMTVDRLVVYVHDREGGNWLGQSLLRPAYKFWLLKDKLLRVQAQTIERNGMGVPLYIASEVPATVTDVTEAEKRQKDEITNGLKIARALRAGDTSGASIPNGADVKLLGVEGQLPNAEAPIRYYDEQIARAVLAHFLNLGGDNSTGSYALGDTFADFFTMSLNTVAIEIADTATQHIVEDLVDINFGEDVPAPRIVFDEIGKGFAADAIKSLVDAGVIHPDDDLEAFVRQALNLPAVDAATRRDESASGGEMSDADRARFAAETAQKVYLATDKPVLNQAEARAIVKRAGAELTGPPPGGTTTEEP